MKLGYNLGLRAGDRRLIQPLGRRISDVLLPFELLTHTCASTRETFAGTRLWGTYPANAVALGQTLGRYQDRWFGQFEEAREALLTYNRQCDHANWTKYLCPVTADASVAPDGNTTADKLVPTTANNVHYIHQSFAPDGSSVYAFSGCFKQDGYDGVKIAMPTAGFPNQPHGDFNLAAGTVYGTSDYYDSIGIVPLVNDWYFVYITATSDAAASGQWSVRVLSGGAETFAGDGSKGILGWNLQAELGAFPSSLIKTEASPVTRAKTETYWDAALVPAVMRDGKHALKLIPFWPSGIRVGSFDIYRLYVDATHYVGFQVYSYGSTKFRISADLGGGVSTYVLTDAITHSAQQELTLILDAAGGSIEVQGATSGDGIYTDTAWNGLASTANCYLGSSHTYVNYFNGLISEFYRP